MNKTTDYLELIQGFLYTVFQAITVFTVIFALSFFLAYVELMLGKYDARVLKIIATILFHFSGTKGTINSAFIHNRITLLKQLMEFAISISVASSSLLLSLFTVISMFKQKYEISRSVGIRKHKLSKKPEAKSDQKIMNDYYKGADKVLIYSSTFEWLHQNNEIKETLKEVLNNGDVRLIITGNNGDELKKKLAGTGLEKCVIPKKSNSAKRFSFVKKGNTRYILYRQDVSETPYIMTYRENINTTLWLEAMESIIIDFIE